MNKSLKIRAFTLVELLVVISIIGLLAGLAVPAINGALKKAKSGACLANLRQIGLGLITYASESEAGKFPTSAGDEPTWAIELGRYINTTTASKKSIFVCPGCTLPVTEGTDNKVAITYGIHSALVDPSKDFPINNIPSPSDLILVGDVCQAYPNKTGWTPNRIEIPDEFKDGVMASDPSSPIDPGEDLDKDGKKTPSLRYRHDGKVNVVMVDGHAESIKKNEVRAKNALIEIAE